MAPCAGNHGSVRVQRNSSNVDKETRQAAFCPHFGPCGGCTLLDLSYEAELELKQRWIEEHLASSPVLKYIRVEPIAGAKRPLFYRSTIKVPFASPKGRVIAGFFEPGSHRIVNLDTCLIQDPVLTRLLLSARELIAERGVPIYDERAHKGMLRYFLARRASGTGEILTGFVVRRSGSERLRSVAQELLHRFRSEGLVGVIENVNSRRTSAIVGEVSRVLVGRPFLRESTEGLHFRTSLLSFAQGNPEQALLVYRKALSMLGPLPGRWIADVYAGYGPIALRLAQRGARVVAIEKNRVAVREGLRAAEDCGLQGRIRYLAGDASSCLRSVLREGVETVVMDPPRKGLEERVIDQLLHSDVRVLVYVSCSPKSLARDLIALRSRFTVKRFEPVDLFPRTDHVETVVQLEGA